MRRAALNVGTVITGMLMGSCSAPGPDFVDLPVETRLVFLNLSLDFYATVGVRDSSAADSQFMMSPLLAPGAAHRGDFSEFIGTGCPGFVDLRLLLYRRINETVPIGDDQSEAVETAPIVAGEIFGLPACAIVPLVAYTIVNWDAPDGTTRVKIAQGSAVEDEINSSGIFPNVDNAWEIDGVSSSLVGFPPPALQANAPISGKVTLPDGTGVSGIGVLIRTFFRVRLADADPTNDPDSGFGDPIAFANTDALGNFTIDRPPGAYQLEFFSDDFEFRPAAVALETPIEVVQIIAEPL